MVPLYAPGSLVLLSFPYTQAAIPALFSGEGGRNP